MLPPTANKSNERAFKEHLAETLASLRQFASGMATCAGRTADLPEAVSHAICSARAEELATEIESLASTNRDLFNRACDSFGNEELDLIKRFWQARDTELTFTTVNVSTAAMAMALSIIEKISDDFGANVKVSIKSESPRKDDPRICVNGEYQGPGERSPAMPKSRPQVIVDSINSLASEICDWAIDKGFWNDEITLLDMIDKSSELATPLKDALRSRVLNLVTTTKQMLVVTEGAELVEGLRAGGDASDQHCGEFCNAEIEAADQIIRLLDLCSRRKWRIGEAIVAKMEANLRRPHQHGKQF